MDTLIQWVTQIIIFLLLASVVDLIIPATSMKRYIRLVVGLILILIFLKPVFNLFNMDVQEAVQTSFDELNNEQTADEQIENSIKTQKSEIQASQNAYILEEMVVQLKDLANPSLRKAYTKEIATIDLSFSEEADPTYENLDELIVYLQEPETHEGGVNVVENVIIDTDKSAISENSDDLDVEGIKQLLNETWEIGSDKIIISGEGGVS